jgi:pimeloyl-ACP methyl ester carboxylesterase
LDQIVSEIVDGPFYLLGHSWGADMALHFTRFYPEMVLGLILLDGGFTFPHNQPEMIFDHVYKGWNDYMDQSVFADEEEIFQEYQTYTKRWDSRKELYAATLFNTAQDGKLVLRASKFTALAIIKAFFKEPFADAYPFINVPLLLIYASHPADLDSARAKGILQLQDNIEDLTVEKLANSSHMLQWDEPEQTASLIIQWLNLKTNID